MDKSEGLIRLALFGQPIKSSLSPTIHRMFADQFGLDISYELIETDAAAFLQALENFRQAGGSGCNVTLPLKRDAWQMAIRSTDEARLAQAANTLIYRGTSGWYADTTDGAGLVADLCVNHGFGLLGKRILILGAGGAVAGILGRLLAGQPRQIVLVNRNLDRARDLAVRFGKASPISVLSWDDLPAQGTFDLVINATSLGHRGLAPELTATLFARDAICYDLNYGSASLPLKQHCLELGQSYTDGLGMLVEQAAASFRIWTDRRPDSRTVIKALRQDLAG